MLRQANDQLEKTMKDKQELEDYMKQSAEDSSNQVQGFGNWDPGMMKCSSKVYNKNLWVFLDTDGLLAVEATQMRISRVSYAPPQSATVSR